MPSKKRTPLFFLVLGSYILGVTTAAFFDGTLQALLRLVYFSVVLFAGLGVFTLLVLLVRAVPSRAE